MDGQAQQAGFQRPAEATAGEAAGSCGVTATAASPVLVIGHAGLRFQVADPAREPALGSGEFMATRRDGSETVLQFAVNVLGVREIVVAAHTLDATAPNPACGIGWHHYLADVTRRYRRALDETETAMQQRHLLHGLSAVEQALACARSPAVLAAWRQGAALSISVHAPDRHGELRPLGLAINAPCLADELRRRAVQELLNQARQLKRRRRESLEVLTQREREVLSHLCDGISNVEISRRMGISRNTVSSHLRNIYDKLGVSQRVQAVVLMASRLPRARLAAGLAAPERALQLS